MDIHQVREEIIWKVMVNDAQSWWVEEANSIPPQKTSYKFRGPLNFDHLINDCLEDTNIGFIAITPDNIHVGILRSVNSEIFDAATGFIRAFRTSRRCFDIYTADKKRTGDAITMLTECCDSHRKAAKKLGRKIRKQNNSNKPETKVMVF